MKIQAILFALLQAHAAVADGSGEDAPMKHAQAELPACALPCKTKLRLSPSKMKECVNAKCGFTIVENEASDHDLEYEEENSHDGEPPISDERSSNIETEEEGDDEADDTEPTWKNRGECISHCRKLRIRQDRCIADCPEDESHESSEKKSNFDADEDKESDPCDAPRPDADEEQESGAGDTSTPDADEEQESDPGVTPTPNACVRQCQRLSITKQKKCIHMCPDEEPHKNLNVESNEKEDAADTKQGYTATS